MDQVGGCFNKDNPIYSIQPLIYLDIIMVKTSLSKSWFKFQESLMTSRKEGDPDNSWLSTRFDTLSGKPGELTAHF